MIELEKLGKRICIIGPSSSGKSTLAEKLSKRLDIAVCHLDQIAHIPNSNWKPRNKDLLKIDHNNFIENNRYWIIEGNYSFLMKKRFSNATIVIWLDFKVTGALLRYFKRTINNSDVRAGNLNGATKQFSLKHIKYMIFDAPKNRVKYKSLIYESNVNLIYIDSFKKLKGYYKKWNL
jgi:adenylate kinase family enzyme